MDLNLLVALDALLEENSVQGAADRLHLSAPAMSRTLTRIRRATGDAILIRAGRSMIPTARALEIRAETADIVRRSAALLTPTGELALPMLHRTFTIRCHDGLLTVLAATLVQAGISQAPHVTLRFVAEAPTDNTDLQHGHVDLDVGATPPPAAEITGTEIGHDTMVAVMRHNHPLAAAPLTVTDFAAARHVNISRRGRTHGPVDDALAAHGLHRSVVAVLPTTTAAFQVLACSDAISVAAKQLCRPADQHLGLVTRPLPITLPPVPVIMLWHRRQDGDPAHRWLRTQTANVLTTALADTT